MRHALDALNAAIDKASYGDSVESDLLEAHATLDSAIAEAAVASGGLRAAADRLVHHYYCRLPTEGSEACPICSAIDDPDERGTQTVLIDALSESGA